jgi:hypothetical protein
MTTIPVTITVNLDDRLKDGKPLVTKTPNYDFFYYANDLIEVTIVLVENGESNVISVNHAGSIEKFHKLYRQVRGVPLTIKR